MKKTLCLITAFAALLTFFSCNKPEEQGGGEENTAKVATVVTVDASSVLSSTITAGGNVTADGGASVTERGLCYGTTAGVTVESGTKVASGAGKGVFEVTLTGLKPGTTYYFVAYAVNSVGVGYGKEFSATTPNPMPATVQTEDVVDAVGTSAVCGGNVTDDGNSKVTARGVCWSKNKGPTIADSKTEDGEGTGEFVSQITGLEQGVTYYVRAYATNDAGTAYGSEKSFSTIEAQLPTLSAFEVTDKTPTSAKSGADITSDGGARITARGLVWATHKNPTLEDYVVTDTETGAGSFLLEMTGLNEGTVYYCRAYATNLVGTAYGKERPFAPFYLDNGEAMLLVKGGTFTVGDWEGCNPNAGDNRWQCTLPDYYIAKTEVTQQLWNEIMGVDYMNAYIGADNIAEGYIWYPVGKDDYNPQPSINWFDAVIFCNKLSMARGDEPCYSVDGETDPDKWAKTGEWEKNVVCDWTKNGFRMPALPEWEWAAGGGENPLQTYPGTDKFSELYLYGQIAGALPGGANEGLFTVATKLPNKLGLYDMVGNATEWVWELSFEYPSDAKVYYKDVITWNYGNRRAVKKGGSIWNWNQNSYYVGTNNHDFIEEHNWPCGLRLAKSKI